jgi:hypothetical protein
MTTESIVQAAILKRRILEFRHTSDGQPVRTGYPHALYLGPENETWVEVFQVAGFASNAPLPMWLSFRIDEIVSAEELTATFSPLAEWDPDQSKYAGGIVAMV